MNTERHIDAELRSARRKAVVAAGRAAMQAYAMQKYSTFKEKYEKHVNTSR